MSKNTAKYMNHTKEEIDNYLKLVKKNVKLDNFIVCTSTKNEKNNKFIEKYKLTRNKQKYMILELGSLDFCYSADDYNNPSERLYLFCRKYELMNWGKLEEVEVYIKIVIKKSELIVVISFHEPEKNIRKLFV